jgi:hypothetical protein
LPADRRNVALAPRVHLGEIGYRVGRVLNFDPAKEQILNDPEANALLPKQGKILLFGEGKKKSRKSREVTQGDTREPRRAPCL